MSKIIVLDSTPLGLISNPRSSPQGDACNEWMREQLLNGTQVAISEIADYEVRRELLRAGRTRSVAKLDGLKQTLNYLPLTTPTMHKAAEFWARARQMGKPTASDHKLDADMILSAQAALLTETGHEVVVATANVAHISLFVTAAEWQDIQ